jgi:MFS family permease
MTIADVVYTEIIYAITILLCELPSGVIADRWSRKNILIISAVLGCFEFLLLLYATEFWHFALVVIIAGISYSLQSGAVHTLLYECLQHIQKTSQLERELGQLEAWQLLAAIFAALSGSLLANIYPLELNYWLSLFSALAALFCSFTLFETNTTRISSSHPSLLLASKQALVFFANQTRLTRIVLVGILLGTSFNFVNEFWQLYLADIGVPVLYFGLFSALCMLFQMLGNLSVSVMQTYAQTATMLRSSLVIFALGLSYIALVAHLTSLIVIGILFLIVGFTTPIISGQIHHNITDDELRTTIDSTVSLAEHIAVMVVGLLFSIFAERWSIFAGFGSLAVLCSLFCLLCLFHKRT